MSSTPVLGCAMRRDSAVAKTTTFEMTCGNGFARGCFGFLYSAETPRTGVFHAARDAPDGFAKSAENPRSQTMAVGPMISVGVDAASATAAAAAADTAEAMPGVGAFGLVVVFGESVGAPSQVRKPAPPNPLLVFPPGPKSPLIHRASGDADVPGVLLLGVVLWGKVPKATDPWGVEFADGMGEVFAALADCDCTTRRASAKRHAVTSASFVVSVASKVTSHPVENELDTGRSSTEADCASNRWWSWPPPCMSKQSEPSPSVFQTSATENSAAGITASCTAFAS